MRIFIAILGAGLALGSIPEPIQGQVRAEVVVDRDGLRSFHLAVGQRYGVPVHVVERHVSARLHPDEIPVVYLLAREARVSPQTVIELRERGWRWIDITLQLRVNPGIFVAHLPRQGPPYGKAHGHWKKPKAKQLRKLSDRQIIDYVNLAFWADHHRQPVSRIIVVREREGSWVRMGGHWNPSRPAVRTAPAVVAPERAGAATRTRAPGSSGPAADRGQPRYKESPVQRDRRQNQKRGAARGARGARNGRGG